MCTLIYTQLGNRKKEERHNESKKETDAFVTEGLETAFLTLQRLNSCFFQFLYVSLSLGKPQVFLKCSAEIKDALSQFISLFCLNNFGTV